MTIQTQSKQITKQPGAKRELREWLQGETFKRELAALLPRTMSPERFVKIAFQAIHRNPDLLKCSQESFFNCLLSLGTMGLEPDGRRAHLIPFATECTLVVDYKGIKELVRRNHDVSAMHCDVVGINDEFDVRFGTHGILDHRPNLENRGKIRCAYSYVKLPDGNEEFDVMNVAEIEEIRKRSRTPNKGPWVTDWNEMAKKTVFRRHAKGLPLSPETREALDREHDADSLSEQERFSAATPALGNVLGSKGNVRTPPVQARTPPESDEPLADDAAAGSDALGNLANESTNPEPVGAPSAVKTPVPDKVAQIRLLLGPSGFLESELLDLMKSLNLAPKAAKSLEDCNEDRLLMVIEDWEPCLHRLGNQRQAGVAP